LLGAVVVILESLGVDVYFVSLLSEHSQSGFAKVLSDEEVFDDGFVFDEIRKVIQPRLQHFVHPSIHRRAFVFSLERADIG